MSAAVLIDEKERSGVFTYFSFLNNIKQDNNQINYTATLIENKYEFCYRKKIDTLFSQNQMTMFSRISYKSDFRYTIIGIP